MSSNHAMRSALAASAGSIAAPCATIIHLDDAAAGEMGSHAPGMRADCRRRAGLSSRAWLLDAADRRPVDRRGHSACQARHAARDRECDALVGHAAANLLAIWKDYVRPLVETKSAEDRRFFVTHQKQAPDRSAFVEGGVGE